MYHLSLPKLLTCKISHISGYVQEEELFCAQGISMEIWKSELGGVPEVAEKSVSKMATVSELFVKIDQLFVK